MINLNNQAGCIDNIDFRNYSSMCHVRTWEKTEGINITEYKPMLR